MRSGFSSIFSAVHAPRRPTRETGSNPTILTSSIANLFDSEYSPYRMAEVRDLSLYPETYFFPLYEESYAQNPWTHALVEYVVTHTIGDGFHFEGPGARMVEKFFAEDGTRTKLEMQFRQAVKTGSGIMDMTTKGKKGAMVKTRLLDPSKLSINMDTDINSKTYGERIYKQGSKTLDPSHLFHMMVTPEYNKAWPMSPLRSVIVFLTALYDCGGDVFAAIKRAAYAPIIASLDLDSLATDDERDKKLKEFSKQLKNIQSSTTNFALDKRHKLELLGTGGGGAKLLPVEDMIGPWLTVALMNFNVPLGMVLQQGANKAILDAQMEDNRIAFNAYRRFFAEQIEQRIIPFITGRECHLVWNKAPPSSPRTQAEMNTWTKVYSAGLISREFFQDMFDIEDTGTTFSDGGGAGPGQPPGSTNENRDDPDSANSDPDKNQSAKTKRAAV